MTGRRGPEVSFDDEPLIVVNDRDEVVDYLPKAEVHAGEGILHRAFSIFLLNERDEILLQQRSAEKPLWPGYWSNACCSHPRRGETVHEAARRRLDEELGVAAEPEYVYTFTYHARYGDAGSERERCSVFLARTSAPVTPNPNEIAEVRWTTAEALDADLRGDTERHTPWLQLEWARLRETFLPRPTPETAG